MPARARSGSVKYWANGLPISCLRLKPVSFAVCSFTSVITPFGSTVISASADASIRPRL